MAERRDRIRVHIEGKEYSVVGGQFKDMLAAVKQINGRRFIGNLKVWQLPGSAEDVQNQLDISGYQLEGGTPVADQVAEAAQRAPAQPGGDRIRVLVGGHQLAVVGGSFQEMLAAVKSLPGRRFDGERKIWEIPGELGIINGLIQAAGFELEGAENIPTGPVPPAESLGFVDQPPPAPPPFAEPDFLDDGDIPPYEPPDWWDDDNMPPPVEPPDLWEDEMADAPPPPPPVAGGEPAPAGESPTARSSDQIRIRVGGIPLVVTGGEFRAMLEVVKKIPGRRFNSAEKLWDIPEDVTIDSVQQVVKAAGFVLQRG